ncbi:hypothetical protein D7Z26_00220 [Cohnella endophytica]|uniref:Lipoprotein n=1 Tax=Cohnella endophytica TaxID=2419778 RepID=A0A494Y5K7_9BACL|nr:hypothetical protein [Cohnella endophytica]RKP57977.1 hypothetical protein D7Z26_00220 [Cohnella endophytica]
MRFLLFTVLVLLLAACDSQNNKGQNPNPNPNPNPYLIIEGHDPLKNLKSKALTKEIDDVEEINELINQIKALSRFPDETIFCPNDNGVNYDLKFKNIFNDTVVNVTATGCQQVKYNNEVYWAMEPQGNQFRSYLLKVLDLSEGEFSGVKE